MSDSTNQSTASGFENPDIKNALLAAFGTDALDWFEASDYESGQESDFGRMPEIVPLTDGSDVKLDVALDQVLQSLSSDAEVSSGQGDSHDRRIEKKNSKSTRHVVFAVGMQMFAIPLAGIQEIDRYGKVTALPRTPGWLRGITNLRGRVFSVTDFRKLLELNDDSPTTGEKIIVIQSKQHEMRTALVVDRVLGIRNLECTQDSASMLSGRLATFSKGISSSHDGTIVLIEPDQLLDCNELRTFSGS